MDRMIATFASAWLVKSCARNPPERIQYLILSPSRDPSRDNAVLTYDGILHW